MEKSPRIHKNTNLQCILKEVSKTNEKRCAKKSTRQSRAAICYLATTRKKGQKNKFLDKVITTYFHYPCPSIHFTTLSTLPKTHL